MLTRLFDDKDANFDRWMESTAHRVKKINLEAEQPPLMLPSKLVSHEVSDVLSTFCERVALFGYAHYEWYDEPANPIQSLQSLLAALSLTGSDRGVIREVGELSLLQDLSNTPKGRFPPYQPKAMSWHTDGYYNAAADAIRCFSLHCIAPAHSGGTLTLMDDTLLIYALLKEDIELVALLSHPEAMTLPENKDELGHDRPDRCVAVIEQQADSQLTLRFTTRSQHIHWRCEATKEAAEHAKKVIDQHAHWHTRLRLQRNQGIISRNVLHTREPFQDAINGVKRQMLRGRFRTLPTPAESTMTTIKSLDSQHATR